MTVKDTRINIFGKIFILTSGSREEFLVHEDFPAITQSDLDAFKLFSSGKTVPVISGCLTDVHPYRLMYTDKNGFAVPLADIPHEIRGNRHFYPEIYEFVPALVWLPAGFDFDTFLKNSNPEIYVMPREKLLDRTLFPDWLFLKKQTG